jgi:hypothetical protein
LPQPEQVLAAVHMVVFGPTANGPKPARLGVVRDEDLLEGEFLAVVDVANRHRKIPRQIADVGGQEREVAKSRPSSSWSIVRWSTCSMRRRGCSGVEGGSARIRG